MIYSTIKSGEIRISRIAVGGNIFGYFADEQLTANILNCAKENGVNFVDTSDSYSHGLSEELIGRAISRDRDWWIVATKCGLESNQSPDGLGKKRNIVSKINGSLRRLRADYLDIYQMHNFDPITPIEETIEALEQCVSEGKIRCYGISNYSLSELISFSTHIKKLNLKNFISAQYPFNLLKRDAKSLFQHCLSERVAIFAYGVLARGLLTEKYLSGEKSTISNSFRAFSSQSIRSDLNEDVILLLRSLSLFASDLGLTLSQMAIKYALSRDEVTAAIVGVRDVHQLRELINAVDTPLLQVECLSELDNMCLSIDSHKLHLGGILRD